MFFKDPKTEMRAYALITVLLWTTAYVFTRVAVRHYAPESISLLRYVIASIVMAGYARQKGLRPPKLRDLPWFLLAGAFGFGLYMYVFNTGAKTVSASVTSFIISASPVISALFARFFLHERISLLGWASIVLSFAGVGVITLCNGPLQLSAGVAWICSAALMLGLYNIVQRVLLRRYTPLEVTAYAIFFGTLMLVAFIPQAWQDLRTASLMQLANIIYLGIFPSALAYLFWSMALSKTHNTAEVTNFMFLTPIATSIMGYFILNETPGLHTFLGGAMVLAGVVLMNKSKRKT